MSPCPYVDEEFGKNDKRDLEELDLSHQHRSRYTREGVHTRDRAAKASSMPRRLTLHREIKRSERMTIVRIPTKRMAILAGRSRFSIRYSAVIQRGMSAD